LGIDNTNLTCGNTAIDAGAVVFFTTWRLIGAAPINWRRRDGRTPLKSGKKRVVPDWGHKLKKNTASSMTNKKESAFRTIVAVKTWCGIVVGGLFMVNVGR
jgi:hypothetical protein